MINKAKFALIGVAAVLFTSPVLAQPFNEDDGTGNAVASENASHHAAIHAARRNGMNSFAMEPRARSDSNSNPYIASRVPPFDPRGTSDYPWGPGYNFPYPDRPYGDPDGW